MFVSRELCVSRKVRVSCVSSVCFIYVCVCHVKCVCVCDMCVCVCVM